MDTSQTRPIEEVKGRGSSVYFTDANLKKIDEVRGVVKRSTFINLMIEHSSKTWMKKLLK